MFVPSTPQRTACIDPVPRCIVQGGNEKSARDLKLRRDCMRRTTCAGTWMQGRCTGMPLAPDEDQPCISEDTMPHGESENTNHNAIDLLLNDHRLVESLFDRFEDEDDPDEALEILRQIVIELAVHARIEEELFYPAARSVLGSDAKAVLDEAAVEHASLKKMIVDLSVLSDQDDFFRAKVKVLGEYVRHHVLEEEGELIPMIESSGIDLDALGRRLRQRKEILLRVHAVPAHDEPEQIADRDGGNAE
jgi:hypothetical protein